MRRLGPAFRWSVTAALGALFLAPVAFMFAASLKPDALAFVEAGSLRAFLPVPASLDNYRDVFERVAFGRFLFNSLWITTCVVAAGLAVNSLCGYALARLAWRGRDAVLTLVLALLIVPFEAIAVPLFYAAAALGWRDTYSVQIVPFIANAFSVYLFYSFFAALPRELEEAAALDGAGPWRTFLRVVAPNAKPAFATAAVLTFLTQWGMFLWPLMVTSGEAVRPLPVAIAAFHTLPPRQWGDILAFGAMMVAPVLVLFLAFQRAFVQGVAAAGLKG